MGPLDRILVLLIEHIFIILIITLSTEKSVKPHLKIRRKSPYNIINFLLRKNSYHCILYIILYGLKPHLKIRQKSPYNIINFLLRKKSYHCILHLIHMHNAVLYGLFQDSFMDSALESQHPWFRT
jgi:hypothetical protein